MTIQIEKGIPVPKQGEKSGARFPFRDMQVGDCFFVPLRAGDTLQLLQSKVVSAAKFYDMRVKRSYKYYTYREYTGIRIWRVE